MSPTTDPVPSAQIAFVCAMPMELEPLTRKLDLHESTLGDMTVHTGTIRETTVVAIVTGMGTELATAGTTKLLDAMRVERVVVVGITGAVENETPIGTLILPEVVVDGATGDEYRPAPLGEGTPAGRMWTTASFTNDLEEIAGLRAGGVVSLDMETAAIAAVCEGRGIPWSVFRVISDRATDGSVDEEVFRLSNMDGSPNNEAIERFFAEHPERVEAMARLAEGALLGAETAADAAIRACSLG
ncbi:MAG: 5'-methylthioadenosine/S-adenosylhomocysteine nucleosidase [Acidimicrobiales bacterium]|jgi:nucleoside phosphorylase